MPNEPYFSPQLSGKRFDDHTIPLELLEDFSALEELVFEIAKYLYKNENPERQRVPRGFMDGISLKLSSIEEGSVIPKILLVAATTGLFPNPNVPYYEQAKERIIQSIDAASRNEDVRQYIPEELLGYFNRIGRGLKDGETIDFSPGSQTYDARLTKAVRKTLVLSSRLKELSLEASIIGTIPEADKAKKTFTIQDIETGQRITAPLNPPHLGTIIDAFTKFEDNCRVFLKGIGTYDKDDRIINFQSIEHISILDPLDVTLRIHELSKLQDGWLNGEGVALNNNDLGWFISVFDNAYLENLPLPYIFPTVDGGLQAEWSQGPTELSLNINLNNKSGFFQLFDIASGDIIERELNLNEEESWTWLNENIANLFNHNINE